MFFRGDFLPATDMRNVNWIEQIYRAFAVGCMLYAVTVVANTARAAEPDCVYSQVRAEAPVPGAPAR